MTDALQSMAVSDKLAVIANSFYVVITRLESSFSAGTVYNSSGALYWLYDPATQSGGVRVDRIEQRPDLSWATESEDIVTLLADYTDLPVASTTERESYIGLPIGWIEY